MGELTDESLATLLAEVRPPTDAAAQSALAASQTPIRLRSSQRQRPDGSPSQAEQSFPRGFGSPISPVRGVTPNGASSGPHVLQWHRTDAANTTGGPSDGVFSSGAGVSGGCLDTSAENIGTTLVDGVLHEVPSDFLQSVLDAPACGGGAPGPPPPLQQVAMEPSVAECSVTIEAMLKAHDGLGNSEFPLSDLLLGHDPLENRFPELPPLPPDVHMDHIRSARSIASTCTVNSSLMLMSPQHTDCTKQGFLFQHGIGNHAAPGPLVAGAEASTCSESSSPHIESLIRSAEGQEASMASSESPITASVTSYALSGIKMEMLAPSDASSPQPSVASKTERPHIDESYALMSLGAVPQSPNSRALCTAVSSSPLASPKTPKGSITILGSRIAAELASVTFADMPGPPARGPLDAMAASDAWQSLFESNDDWNRHLFVL